MLEAQHPSTSARLAGAAIAAALFAANLSGGPHRYSRPNGQIRSDAPIFVTTTYSVNTAGCSSDRQSTEDLATYGALSVRFESR